MSTRAVRFRGHRIELLAFEVRDGWGCAVTISDERGGLVSEISFADHLSFESADAAEDFGAQWAMDWIERGRLSGSTTT